ncbi:MULTISPECIES: tetratricopeptide repeat protein [unclassified Pseudomonas]|uniref:tetratricopeptide repeat protein n=1 Tax=unclassified Pseudomonas TaxID=196821 RepID=UPI0005BD21F5|nr:SEL1-like repeat protein [Pseudomonas sp. M47T1]
MHIVKRGVWLLRARISYWVARQLFHWPWFVRQPRGWEWLEGQFSRMANLGDLNAMGFYGHILLFRGKGLAARDEGLRLVRLAAERGDAKAAYQMGVTSLAGTLRSAPDAVAAVHWWEMALAGGHPLAAFKLAQLYRQGGPGLAPDPERAARYAAGPE